MSEAKSKARTEQRTLRSQFVSLTVEKGPGGNPRLVLDGAYMLASGFEPGEVIEAIVQPNLISILRIE